MVAYRANGEGEIKELFDREGDSLAKAGFTEPDLTHAPEEYPATQLDLSRAPANEWEASGNATMYTAMNARAVEQRRRQEASGELGGTVVFRALE